MIRCLLRWLWKRDSESAYGVLIHVAHDMIASDLSDAVLYLASVSEHKFGRW